MLPFHIYDVFTDSPFTGNPLAIVEGADGLTTAQMQTIARQFNLEYRAADAAACPHLALAAVVHAGCQGIEEGLPAPTPTEEDLSLLSEEALASKGFQRLPTTLDAALDRLANNPVVSSWFGEFVLTVYRLHKQSEIAHVAEMGLAQTCRAYETTY